MALIRATRETVNDRFNVLSFNVRSDSPLFEVGLATDPDLLRPENRAKRTTGNFYSSRVLASSGGRSGDAVYLVPPSVVARFVGQPRLYFGLATYSENDRSRPTSVRVPDRGNMYVSLSGLTERGLRRTARPGSTGSNGGGYGGDGGANLVWGGDVFAGSGGAGTVPAAAPATGNGAPAANANGGSGYSDGYSDDLWQQQHNAAANGNGAAAPTAAAPANGTGGASTAPAPAAAAVNGGVAPAPAATTAPAAAQAYRVRALSTEDDAYGIEGPIPDDAATAISQGLRGLARPFSAPSPQYPQASRFAPADAGNFRAVTGTPRTIDRVVIHITDGGANINGTIGWFQNPAAKVSAHYVIGQDGEVVQMVRHEDVAWHARSANGTSIGIEHVANTRGLNPTPAQMCASAALVTWLCDQYGIAADRTHILGHSEADPATTHTGCPNAVWDWTYFMGMVTSRTCYLPGDAPATTQGLRGRGNGAAGYPTTRQAPSARAMRVVSSYYQPTDWLDALRTQAGFFLSSAQWFFGVDDTTVAPHSAICQARRSDGSAEGAQHGTAFFIGPRLLLTAAHVVDGQSELIIVPGKNGAGTATANEPFGRFRVGASDMVKHPSYVSSNRDFDMALIRVPAENAVSSPNYFDLVEELTQSRPEGVVVTGYAAYSADSSAVGTFVNNNIDADKQHMHGGYIRTLPSDETFDYDLQSLGGTSGSPVYYINEGDSPRAHMVGVHVAGESDTTNLGCRITPAKLAWIRQQATAWGETLTFSLGARSQGARATNTRSLGVRGARALSEDEASTEDYDAADRYSIGAEPVDDELAAAQSWRGARGLDAPQAADYPGASRFVPAAARNFMRGRRRGAVIDRIVIHITAGGPNINGTIGWFQDGQRIDPKTGEQAGPSSAHYVVGRDGEVVQMVRNADTAYHASAANSRSIGIEHNANKPYRLNRRDLPPTMPQYEASAHLVAWLCSQYSVPIDREHIVGHSEASPGDNHDCPSSYWDWDVYMQCVQLAAAAQAQGTSTGAVPVTSQGLRRGGYSRAQEIIAPFYDPSDPSTALMCQDNAFSQALEEWFVGVDDTHAFPHSAICQLQMDNGVGTGFYIGRNRILTCAHNLEGSSQVTIIPGKNGAGNEPFGNCTVPASSWRIAPGYVSGGNGERDLAVIENVPLEAPNGAWFGFLSATPSDQMPLVVCGYSRKSDAVPELTALMNGDKQHLHGGYARSMSSQDLIEYPILTLHRASGSPVYHLDRSSGQLEAKVCAVHISGAPAAQGLNRGCFLTPAKLDWIEGRTTTFSYGGGARSRALEGGADYPVALVPQPDKNACWAASMAMLLSYRRNQSIAPETLAQEVGASLATSYDWALLDAVKQRYGFQTIEQPSNASLYHTPQQWADWLASYGPLWVVIVGAPHAVVLAGIRGNLADPAHAEVKILNPWDTRVAFDNDPVAFNPANGGYEGWLSFDTFASDFGNMAEPDYGNWRVLHLPAQAAAAQSLGMSSRGGLRLARPPAPIRARALEDAPAKPDAASNAPAAPEPIEPSRVPGTRMSVTRGSAGACRWALDQLEGAKAPATSVPSVSSGAQSGDTVVDLNDWPAIDGAATPLPLRLVFWHGGDGSVGNIHVETGLPANLAYGVEVAARIDDTPDVGNLAALKVTVDYRFTGLAQGNPAARIELRLLGDGRIERVNTWVTQPAGAAVAA
jgi:N-acetyl-anhydromuramyl-L-alanine amidase AmpD/V8-like Glu-specific endopeptidase